MAEHMKIFSPCFLPIILLTLATYCAMIIDHSAASCVECKSAAIVGVSSTAPEQLAINESDQRKLQQKRLLVEKRKLLMKLQLKSRPDPVNGSKMEIPDPISHSLQLLDQTVQQQQQLYNDQEAHTAPNEVYVFTEVLSHSACSLAADADAVCFSVHNEFEHDEFSTVFLWLKKLSSPISSLQQQSELDISIAEVSLVGTVDHVTLHTASLIGDWLKIEVSEFLAIASDRKRQRPITFVVKCETTASRCAFDTAQSPFLEVVNTTASDEEAKRRRRRHEECIPGLYNNCCLKKWYVNFTEMGWNDWIVQPAGYHANYCTGNCRHQATIVHTSMLINSFQTKVLNGERVDPELIPCCSPTTKSSLAILYALKPNKFVRAILEDMIVEACGC